jgi:hypothetical protein
MQVDYNLYGDPIRNLWAAVIMTALDDLKIQYDPAPKYSGGKQRQIERRRARHFFRRPYDSNLSWICFHLGIDLDNILEAAKKNLSFEDMHCYRGSKTYRGR